MEWRVSGDEEGWWVEAVEAPPTRGGRGGGAWWKLGKLGQDLRVLLRGALLMQDCGGISRTGQVGDGGFVLRNFSCPTGRRGWFRMKEVPCLAGRRQWYRMYATAAPAGPALGSGITNDPRGGELARDGAEEPLDRAQCAQGSGEWKGSRLVCALGGNVSGA